MNSRSPRRPQSVNSGSADLVWIHDGLRHRVSVWPEVLFSQETTPGGWEPAAPSEGALASAALGVGAAHWRRYLEYVPAGPRDFLLRFEFSRMAALLVVARCPTVFGALVDTPALIAFLAAHRTLRGGAGAGWAEIEAVFEREGIFGLLQWLGLPASRQTLAILRNIADPDLPPRLLVPLRSALWDPEVIWSLSHTTSVTDEHLANACHALAA